MSKRNSRNKTALPRFFTLEMFALTVAILSGLVLLYNLLSPVNSIPALFLGGCAFTLAIVVLVRLVMDPDSVRARQTDSMLKLASQTTLYMQEGLDRDAAERICHLLLPSTAAIAVSITDQDCILGYAGYQEVDNSAGSHIRTKATSEAIADGEMRIILTPEEIGFPQESDTIKAAIIVPLHLGRDVFGVLKFYYRHPKHISETQKSIAEGFGHLLSTQMAAAALEEQTKLATSMELKMLQSQINPHFLFNTINTIASLVRTDPATARTLLREFALFYRRTLENSDDLIVFNREMEQTKRYFAFEVARFGSDRVELVEEIEACVNEMMVPPFLIQPLVENAVRHAMPSEGKLLISIEGEVSGDDVLVRVIDNGVGMDEKTCESVMNPQSTKGMGIAVKNVHDRIAGYYGPEARMLVESKLGEGTRVTLLLKNANLLEQGMSHLDLK